jgi:3-oxoacyl-[acyl-carrier-protein] synthase II
VRFRGWLVAREDTVWITGVGTANPLGSSYEATADALLAGRSGIRRVAAFSVPDHLSQIAGLIGSIPVPSGWDETAFRQRERLEQLLLWCSAAALRSAGLGERRADLRVGLTLGLGAGLLTIWEEDRFRGGRRIHEPEQDRCSFLELVQEQLGLVGPSAICAAACASGNYALALARRWIQLGWVDLCLAGAGDMAVSPLAMACFGNMRALSRRNDQPEAASRPFDRDRDGFVMSEGGAVFVLEASTSARRRGVRPWAEIAGCGASSNAFHMVIPSTDPEPAVVAMRQALEDAAINPDEIDYVNAHATSTPAGDTAEAKVLQLVLGEAAPRVPVSSTKSMTGHLLSGAAAINALACLAALERQALPPTINLDDPDPDCALCHVANQAQERPVRVAVSNSLGFGGSNTCLVLRRAA